VIELNNDDIVKAITAVQERSKSNSHRIENLEQNARLLNKMVTAIEVLATQQKTVAEHVEKIDLKVTKIEQSPIKKLSTVIGYILAALCSAGAGWLFGTLG
jgi:hypothetical protein